MAEISLNQQQLAASSTDRVHSRSRQAAVIVGATALVALSAHISIPLGFTPVPITLQPFAVLLLGLLLAPGISFAALTLYLLEGAIGLPVFSPHGLGGIAQLFGPTGGYLLAAPFAAAAAGAIYRKGKSTAAFALLGAVAGDLILLVTGALWLGVLTHVSALWLFREAIAPFLGSDALKIVAATLCAHLYLSLRMRPDTSKRKA